MPGVDWKRAPQARNSNIQTFKGNRNLATSKHHLPPSHTTPSGDDKLPGAIVATLSAFDQTTVCLSLIDLYYSRTLSLRLGALFLSTNNRTRTTSPTVCSSYQPIFIQSQSWQLLLLLCPLMVMPNPHLQMISQLFLFRPTAQMVMMRTRTPTERVVQTRNKSQFSMTRITSM